VGAPSLHPILTDVLDAATVSDWQKVTHELAAEAREALGEPPTPTDVSVPARYPQPKAEPDATPTASEGTNRAPDITATVTRSVAETLLAKANFGQDGCGCWIHPDGRRTPATNTALSWALVDLAEG
jgi:hypothetical protein